MQRLIPIAALVALTGCVTHAGPFITQISPAGPGRLNVQKCAVEYNKMTNEISTSDCTIRTIEISTGQASPWSSPPPGWSPQKPLPQATAPAPAPAETSPAAPAPAPPQ